MIACEDVAQDLQRRQDKEEVQLDDGVVAGHLENCACCRRTQAVLTTLEARFEEYVVPGIPSELTATFIRAPGVPCPECGGASAVVPSSPHVLHCARCHFDFVASSTVAFTVKGAVREGASGRLPEITLDAEFRKRYQMRNILGSGAAGMVVRAIQLPEGRPVAVKFFVQPERPALLERFLQEGRLLASLDHPNIVKVLDMGSQGGHPYLVMEELAGGTLRSRMTGHAPWDWQWACQVMGPCLEGLKALHRSGIIHRDLKPENILFRANGDVVIADLGIARSYSEASKTQTGMILGTPSYMSPEQARGEAPAVGSDLYSIGIIFHEMVTGRTPFRGGDVMKLLQDHIRTPPPQLSGMFHDMPPRLVRLMDSALAKSLADRPQGAGEMARIMREELGGGREAVRPTSRSRKGWGVVGVVGGLVLAALITLLRTKPQVVEPEQNYRLPTTLQWVRHFTGSGDCRRVLALIRGDLARSKDQMMMSNLCFELKQSYGDLTHVGLRKAFAEVWLECQYSQARERRAVLFLAAQLVQDGIVDSARYGKPAELFQEIVSSGDRDLGPLALLSLGTLEMKEEPRKAMQHFEEMRYYSGTPLQGQASFLAGTCHRLMGDDTLAARSYEETLRLHAGAQGAGGDALDPYVHHSLADTLIRLTRKTDAAQHLRLILSTWTLYPYRKEVAQSLQEIGNGS